MKNCTLSKENSYTNKAARGFFNNFPPPSLTQNVKLCLQHRHYDIGRHLEQPKNFTEMSAQKCLSNFNTNVFIRHNDHFADNAWFYCCFLL
jgi:hypothetical protein